MNVNCTVTGSKEDPRLYRIRSTICHVQKIPPLALVLRYIHRFDITPFFTSALISSTHQSLVRPFLQVFPQNGFKYLSYLSFVLHAQTVT